MFCVGVSMGESHSGVLVLRTPKPNMNAHHQACRTIIGELMLMLEDLREINLTYYQPLLEKLNLAKPLMSREELEIVFPNIDAMAEV